MPLCVSCVRVHQPMIPDDMGIPSPAVLAYRGGAMLNFAITEFYEVPQSSNFVRCSTYISLRQEYAPVVTWPAAA